MSKRKAFTIVELAVFIALASAIFAITLPRASAFIDNIEVRGAVTEIQSMFSLARHVAIARGTQVSLDIDAGSGTISVRAGSEPVRSRSIGAAHRVSVSANRTSITYSPIGVGYGAANLSLVVSRNRAADTVVVSRLGRVRH